MMNTAQKDAIRDMGFGMILDFPIEKIPLQLAYFVLDNFDARKCELNIPNGRTVKITEDDVTRIFGLPSGKKEIVLFNRTEDNDLFEQWVLMFGSTGREKIKIKKVASKMLECVDGGSWFKRHFIIMLAFSLFESTTNGTVHPFIMHCLSDLGRLNEWNWPRYVLETLIDHKRSWTSDKTRMFAGPSLFLVLFYVDRFEINIKPEKRAFPLFTNWTTQTLRDRQKTELDDGFFGGGSLCSPIEIPAEHYRKCSEVFGHYALDNSVNEDEGSILGKKIMQETLFIASRLDTLKKMIGDAPISQLQNKDFSDSVAAAQKILGITIDVNAPTSNVGPSIPREEDAFFYRDDLHAIVDQASSGGKDKNGGYSNRNTDPIEAPNFDLLETQVNEDATLTDRAVRSQCGYENEDGQVVLVHLNLN